MMNGLDDFNFADYQAWAKTTAIYPDEVKGLYPLLGLVGETGEVVEKILDTIHILDKSENTESLEKVGKIITLLTTIKNTAKEIEVLKKDIRKNGLPGIKITITKFPEKIDDIKKEIGDQQWYQSAVATDFGLNLQDVAQTNHDKLESRKKRNVLNGSGDNR